MKLKTYSFLFFTAFISLLILQLHNLSLFPPTKGFDAGGHIEYINLLKSERRVPLANEGWELYQPPLYYFVSVFLPGLKAVQWLGPISWLLIGISGFSVFRRAFPSHRFTGTLLLISLPVIIYLTPTISNELFTAALISLSLAYYWLKYPLDNPRHQLLLGLLLDLSLLAKATAWILVLAILIDQLRLRRPVVTKFTMSLPKGYLLFTIVLVASWFYIRNLTVFGNPFATSVDFPQFAITQTPVKRDLKFFTDLSAFTKLDLFRAHWYSFIPGTFFTFFYDGHNIIVPIQPFSKAGALLAVASLPLTLLALAGLIKLLRSQNHRSHIFILYAFLLLAAYIAYNFKLPFYSSVKGSFIASVSLPLVFFYLTGLQSLKPKLKNLTTPYLILYVILVLKNFWLLAKWI